MLGQLAAFDNEALYARLTNIMLPTCIWAEESGDITSRTNSEWSFGNGASGYPLARGLVIGVPKCRVLSMTLDIGEAAAFPAISTVQLTKNGTDTGFSVQTNYSDGDAGRRTGYNRATTDITFTGGQVLNFRTSQGGSETNRGVVCVWLEIFPE